MPKQILQLLKIATKKIPQLDAELLLSHTINKSREFLITHPEYTVSRWGQFRFQKRIFKRAKGVPLAYLTGHKEFFGLNFLVNKHTLIPRPETEVLVETVLSTSPRLFQGERQKGVGGQKNIILIDIGTGSGCIPISILKSLPRGEYPSSTWATDISKTALKIAHKNAQKHGADITFFHGNLLEPVLKNHELRTLNSELIITANLPYLTQEQFDTEESIQHEPTSALVAEDDGLKLYKELLEQIKNLLTTCNLQLATFFEIDPSQSEKLSEYIQITFPDAKIEIITDGMKNDRVVKTIIDKKV